MNKRKKVIFLVPWLSGFGGTEQVIHNLFKEYFKNQSKTPFDFELYSLGGFIKNTNLKFNNVHIISFPNDKFLREILYIFLLPLLIPYIIIKSKADAVISINPILWTIAKFFICIFRIKIPLIAWYQYSYAAKHVKKFYLKRPNYFLTISKSGKKELVRMGISSNKIYVIYNPVIPSKRIIKHSNCNNQFVYVGRIEYSKQKNIQELFKALSRIHCPWTLRIYGKGFPNEIESLKILSIKLKISNKIKWMGFKRNALDHIKIADALILTSNFEGFSMVIAEAISHGLYVISSNCPNGPSELIHKCNGDLYQLHNIPELVNLIKDVINGNKRINYQTSKKSIGKMYVDKYFRRVISSLISIEGCY